MTTVTISKQKYELLKREATAWRHAIGPVSDTVIFNAVRDNGGKGVPIKKFIRTLRKLELEDKKVRA